MSIAPDVSQKLSRGGSVRLWHTSCRPASCNAPAMLCGGSADCSRPGRVGARDSRKWDEGRATCSQNSVSTGSACKKVQSC